MRCRTRVVPLRTVNESLNGDARREAHASNARHWPARHGYPVGRFCHLEVVHAGDVSTMLSPVSSQMSIRKAKCVLVFMGKSDSTRPRPVYLYAMFLRTV
jgi:hypothetical protein